MRYSPGARFAGSVTVEGWPTYWSCMAQVPSARRPDWAILNHLAAEGEKEAQPDQMPGANDRTDDEVAVNKDATSTSALSTAPMPEAAPPEVEDGLRVGRVTTFEDWKAIDAEEIRRGKAAGKERERFVSWDEAREFLTKVKTQKDSRAYLT